MAATPLLAQEAAESNSSSSYDGPNVMGRGDMRIGLLGADSVPIRFSFNVGGTYDTLLGAFRTDENGNLAPGAGSYGVQGGFDVSGQKRFRRAILGISYNGNYNYFPGLDGFNGLNQALNLGYSRRLGRRLEMNWINTASLTNRLLGNPLNQQALGADLASAPVNELFDNRIFFLQSQMTLSYRLSSRWQLVGGGNGGVVRRQASSLAGVNVYGGTAGIMYRWSRNTTIGINYDFSHFNFGRSFGESNIHGSTVNFARRIGRDWQVNASVGGQSIYTVGARRVALDPVIAALLGSTEGVEAFSSRRWVTSYGAGVERRIRRSSFTAQASRSVVPGNGLLLTSVIDLISFGMTYTATRDWSLNAGASRSSMTDVSGSNLGRFDVSQVQAGVNRTLNRELGMFGTVEYRTFALGISSFDRSGFRFTVGLTYTPTSLPFGR
jgi:hypothetical protein